MYIHPVLWISTAHDLDANDSHLRLCLTCAIGLCLSVLERFLSLGFASRSINALLTRSPYVPYVFPLSIPYMK